MDIAECLQKDKVFFRFSLLHKAEKPISCLVWFDWTETSLE